MTTDWWRLDAACLGLAHEQGSFDVFYEEEFEREAKLICAGCNVRLQCLSDAIETQQYYGVRGGLNPKERTSIGRRHRYWLRRTDRPKPFVDWVEERTG